MPFTSAQRQAHRKALAGDKVTISEVTNEVTIAPQVTSPARPPRGPQPTRLEYLRDQNNVLSPEEEQELRDHFGYASSETRTRDQRQGVANRIVGPRGKRPKGPSLYPVVGPTPKGYEIVDIATMTLDEMKLVPRLWLKPGASDLRPGDVAKA